MMQRIEDLDLYHLDWATPEFAADPYPRFEAARAKHPWLAKSDAGYVIFDLEAIRDLLVRDDQLRTSFGEIVDIMEARGSRWGRFAEDQMIAMPAREHKVLRDAFAAKFSPRYANSLRPVMREEMRRLLAEWAPKGAFDFEEFVSYYPVAVMCRMIGAPVDAIPSLRASMEALGLAFSMDKRIVPKLDAAMEHLDAFVFALVAERRAKPRGAGEPDLLDLVIETVDKGQISERQMADLLIFLFVAGYDTSKNAFSYMVRLLMRHPDIYRRCAEDLDYCRDVVEESLRMFTPSSTFRATNEEIVYRGVAIPKDTMLFFMLNVASRISPQIAHPEIFDPEREVDSKHRLVGFGLGKHMCLGQYIARTQIQEGLHLVAQHLRAPHETAEPGWRPFPGVWGVKGLPVAFTPA